MTYARHNPHDLDAEELAGPVACNCARCGEDMRDAGLPPASMPDSLVADLIAMHGGAICHDCATDYVACADCSEPLAREDACCVEGTTEPLCGECHNLTPEAQAAALADDRIKEGA